MSIVHISEIIHSSEQRKVIELFLIVKSFKYTIRDLDQTLTRDSIHCFHLATHSSVINYLPVPQVTVNLDGYQF